MYNIYKELLKKYLSFKTISAQYEDYKQDFEDAIDWIKHLFVERGFNAQIIENYSHPIIFAEYIHNKDLETVLVYGHYDVQPASKDDGWNFDPFVLNEDSDKIYGRGVVDNKGQSLIHFVSIFDLIKENKLNYNIKIIIEGGEEISSPKINEFLKDYSDLLNCDFIIASDGLMANNKPTLEMGLRGIVNFELTIGSAKTDLHSGSFGGVVPNAITEMTKFLNKIVDEEYKILIDNFYENVDEIDEKTKKLLENNFYDKESLKRSTTTKDIFADNSLDYYKKVGLQPSMSITGISGGYTGTGIKTIIPSKCTAKISFRIVESQSIEEVKDKFEIFCNNNISGKVDFDLNSTESVPPSKSSSDNKYSKHIQEKFKKVYKDEIQFMYLGGSLPVIYYLKKYLNVPVVSPLLGNSDARMHGVDENFDKEFIKKGLKFSKEIFST